ncbi:MAG: tripartite tricarboxylate transporter substrate binding protein [Betaproteobacteria bacterium]|nr:tripartite tricarboxylate transporter substrate binding protein [Betaproteobacteria bacterium]MBI3936573.1 tripartite tricarboxylate transporter substrate binding protein [Betaproteobacteria bacterium]
MNVHLPRAVNLFAALAIGIACSALAQTYPTRAVRLIVGFPPGGTVDLLARITAPKLSERWGQQAVVDNRPGAGSTIAAEIVAKANADGYTLLMITMSYAVSAGLYQNLAYHPVDSFAPVTLVGSTPMILLAHPSLPVKSLSQLIALAKARPGQLNFASAGAGSFPHLAGELLKRMAGIDIVHVPYKGAGPAFTDLVGGHVELQFASLPGSLPYIRAGKVRPIAVTSAKRSRAMPEVPTIAESGIAGYELTNWYGLLAPAGTDRKIVERLNGDFVAILQIRDVAEAFARVGAEPVTSTPREFEVYLRSEVEKWSKVIKDAGIRSN